MPAPIVAPGKTQIGWIGTGIMGASMCSHLLHKGFSVRVSNRTRSKAEALLQQGAQWVDSPRQLAAECDVVFAIVGMPPDVREVFLGEQGLLAGSQPGTILVDMTTTQPALAIEIAEAARKKDVDFLDAPVSGGAAGARSGHLSIMIGGDAQTAQVLNPCWEALGSAIHQGPAGSGQHAKQANQILVALTLIGICESLLYGYKAGLQLDVLLRSITGGSVGSKLLANAGAKLIENNFDPGFMVEHFLKDLGIALEESRRSSLALPGLALAEQLYLAVQAQGNARNGTQALMLALARLNAIDWPQRDDS